MTQKSWPWSTVAGLGDGAAELNEALSREFLAVYFGVQDPTVEGVSKGVGGELEVTGTASPLAVASGSGICYGLYINDASVNTPAIATPAVGTTGGRVVLQTNWAGTGGGSLEARTRVAVRMSADGVGTPPALVQSFGTTWEVSLATFTITTGGVITVTDARTFRRSTGVVGAAEIDNDSVGNAELRNSAAVSVIGRAANSSGDPADIAAGANDRLLTRVANALAFTQLTAGMVPNELVTAAMIANRTRTFFVRLFPTDATHMVLGLQGYGMPDAVSSLLYGVFMVPPDFVSGMTIAAVVVPEGTGNLRWSLTANYGADGQNTGSDHAATSGATTTGVTDLVRDVLPTVALADAAIGDYVGVQFFRDGSNVLDTVGDFVNLQGLLVSYLADS